ncbi:MAG: hypothetical protein Q8P32_01240 [Candidatus Komeilibacteria bacterium]|nr:hypothetical protein [Candidatus Komeilibacteria bacterium]
MKPELPQASQENFEEKKRRFFVGLGLKYKDYLQFHNESGQTKRDAQFGQESIINKRGETLERNKRWGDVTEHCLVEAAMADIAADLYGLPDNEKQTLIIAALLHDWRKRGEIEEGRGESDPQKIEAIYQKSKEGLWQGGLKNPEEVSRLIESISHISLPGFAELQEDNSIKLKDGLDQSAMIIHYIDEITRGTDIVTLDERLDYLDKVVPERYPYNEQGKSVWGGRTFFEAQREIGHLIEDKLAAKLGLENPKDLPVMLKQKLLEKINKQ